MLDSLDGVLEALHPHFTKTDDGKFKVSSEDVSGLKSALEKERQERKAAKEALKAYEGIDPAHYKELTEKEQALKEKKLIDAGKLDDVVAERTGRMKSVSIPSRESELLRLGLSFGSRHRRF